MTKQLHFGRGLSVSAEDFIEQKTAILGKSGGGKSGLVKVITEELCEAKMPFVIIDPVGIHYGLRSSFDGKKPGYEILVVGGEHSNVPLDRRSGADVARVVVEKNVSCVIDLTGMVKAAWREFVEHFADELFKINKTPRLVILEESQEFIPQRINPGMGGCYEAVDRGVTIGRNRGLGWVLVGQRPASINKTSLSQCDTVIMFGTLGKHDRKALEEWVEAKAKDDKLDEFIEALAGLENREAWIWSPVALKEFRKFKTKEFTTFHPDRTHLRKHGMLDVKPVEADIEGAEEMLQGSLKALAEQKKDEARLPQLKAQIKQLEAKLEGLSGKEPPKGLRPAAVDEKAVERRIRQAVDAERKRLDDIYLRYEKKVASGIRTALQIEKVPLLEVIPTAKRALAELEEALTIIKETKTNPPTIRPSHPPTHQPSIPATRSTAIGLHRNTNAPQSHYTTKPSTDDGASIGNSPRRILQSIAQLHSIGISHPTKKQVATWTGFAQSGTYSNYLSKLATSGLIAYEKGGIALTAEGQVEAGDTPPPPTQDDLFSLAKKIAGNSPYRILEELVKRYPDAVSKPELAEATGFTMSGTFSNYLSRLNTLGFIEYADGGVKADPVIFVDGR